MGSESSQKGQCLGTQCHTQGNRCSSLESSEFRTAAMELSVGGAFAVHEGLVPPPTKDKTTNKWLERWHGGVPPMVLETWG